MSQRRLRDLLQTQLDDLKAKGLYKRERQLQGPQGAAIKVADREVINFCANNYLGLANHPDIVAAAKEGLTDELRPSRHGVRPVPFICGTQDNASQTPSTKQAVARFLYEQGRREFFYRLSCWESANGGLFETILGEEDAVISDELNHASIIDGVRLCKSKRFRYKNCDLTDLKRCLIEAKDARLRLIATDGVFSMDGSTCPVARHLPRWPTSMTPSSWWMTATPPESSAPWRPRQALDAHWMDAWNASTSSPARSAKRSAARPVASPAAVKKSSIICASVLVPTSSPTPCRLRSSWRQ